MPACLVPGCTNDTQSPFNGRKGHMCSSHWFRLSLETRKRWWDVTDYGKKPPTRELREAIIAELEGKP